MWVDGGGSGSCDGRGVCESRGFLFLRHFLAKLAVRWLVDSPRHVMDAPVKSELSIFLGLGVALLGRDLLPCFIFFLLLLVGRVLLVFRLALLLTAILVVVIASGNLRQLRVQLELTFELVDLRRHGNDLVVVRGAGAPLLLVDEPVKLALGHLAQGLVGDACEIAIEICVLLVLNVLLEVVAWDCQVCIE